MVAGLDALIAVVGLTLLASLAALLFSRSAARGAPFQPSEPDPWPRGVQEDEDVRWNRVA